MSDFFSIAGGLSREIRRRTRRSSSNSRPSRLVAFALALALLGSLSACDSGPAPSGLSSAASTSDVAPGPLNGPGTRVLDEPLAATGPSADISFERLVLPAGGTLRAQLSQSSHSKRRRVKPRRSGSERPSLDVDPSAIASAPVVTLSSRDVGGRHVVALEAAGLGSARVELLFVPAGTATTEPAWSGAWSETPSVSMRAQPRSVHYVHDGDAVIIVYDYHGGGSEVAAGAGFSGAVVDLVGYRITGLPGGAWDRLDVDGFAALRAAAVARPEALR